MAPGRWDTPVSAVPSEHVRRLAEQFRGRVIPPTDPDFEQARRVWNGAVDRRPGLIARCATSDDVRVAVSFATEHDLPTTIRGGAHGVSGDAVADDALMIDLSAMRRIRCDPRVRVATVQGGATWADLDRASARQGRAVPGGQISTTGVSGLTLGGGLGWLMRHHGLTVDSLLSVDVVLADGRRVTANDEENTDLAWALRGGGGNYGVATDFTFRMHDVDTVLAGSVVYPADRATDVLVLFRNLCAAAPRELTLMAYFLPAMSNPLLPDELQGRPVVSIVPCWTGEADDGRAILGELRGFGPPALDTITVMPYAELQRLFDFSAPFGLGAYWKSRYLTKLDDDALQTIADWAQKATSPLSQVLITQMGGAISEVDQGATAFGHREAAFVLEIIAKWEVGQDDVDGHKEWADGLWEATAPWSDGGVYVNFLGDEPERIRNAYLSESYQRLRRIKAAVDPDNFFHFNRNIPPAE